MTSPNMRCTYVVSPNRLVGNNVAWHAGAPGSFLGGVLCQVVVTLILGVYKTVCANGGGHVVDVNTSVV